MVLLRSRGDSEEGRRGFQRAPWNLQGVQRVDEEEVDGAPSIDQYTTQTDVLHHWFDHSGIATRVFDLRGVISLAKSEGYLQPLQARAWAWSGFPHLTDH